MASAAHSTNVLRFPTRRRKAFRIAPGTKLGSADLTNLYSIGFARSRRDEPQEVVCGSIDEAAKNIEYFQVAIEEARGLAGHADKTLHVCLKWWERELVRLTKQVGSVTR